MILSAAATLLLLNFDEAISRSQQRDIADTRRQLADMGVTNGTLTATLDEMRERLFRNEQAIEDLKKGITSPSVTPPAAPSGTYSLTDSAKRAIQETTQPGAVVSIIPFMPNLEPFARQLGEALAAVPAVQVAVGGHNFIMNGQTGLIVQYDHANPVSASVFNALVKAGLNPTDGPATPRTSVVFIKVAPKP